MFFRISREVAVLYGFAIFAVSLVLGLIQKVGGGVSVQMIGGNVLLSAAVTAGAIIVLLSLAGLLSAESHESAAVVDALLISALYLYACFQVGFAGLVSPVAFLPQMLHDWWPVVLFVVVGIPLIHLIADLIMRWKHRGEPPEGPLHPMGPWQ